MYSRLKPLLFKSDPERIHERVMGGLEWAAHHPGALRLIDTLCGVHDPKLETRAFGLTFPSPIGLAAGFDKNALAVPTWAALGFGFVEIGSVTAKAQPGNPKPRLFRLPNDEALINRMGFNNDGAAVVAGRLERLQSNGFASVPIGVNVGKSKVAPLDEAAEDYLESLRLLWPHGDYFVINVSSPNTPGLRALQEQERLTALLSAVTEFAARQPRKPLLLKLAPDLNDTELAEIAELAVRFGLSGLVATNTTLAREGLKTHMDETGGLSGQPLKSRSLEVLTFLQSLGAGLPIVSVGGIATVDDVWERLSAGAVLVQLYSSFVYEGPFLLRRLNRGLVRRLEREQLTSLNALAVT